MNYYHCTGKLFSITNNPYLNSIPSFRIPCSFGSLCPCPCKSPCPCGRPGPTGPTGADGLSAYQVAIEAGYTGTLEEWLSGLVGATGATGQIDLVPIQ